ncbi:hypothetical protein SAMN05421863_101165 [Nitrosomonas communis]|uniref:DUF5615 domain-containing protein n=1 Tax=Nitrosomonas communis TaxID=44574 RepID=A0A1I4MSZ9_9PROT|nr:hypothetical protein SAMN05421863_101165 [Nitrosomonas communis]
MLQIRRYKTGLKCKFLRHNFAVIRKPSHYNHIIDLAQKIDFLDTKLVRIGKIKKSKEVCMGALAAQRRILLSQDVKFFDRILFKTQIDHSITVHYYLIYIKNIGNKLI